ncbi:MAG: BMC domain-containing protein [Syntrophobacteraceae bacterium]|nr:BMC domain-containing protein [Syntrophobacteraceae bacterium]
MQYRAIGLLELNSVAKGVQCADEMIKSANVELILARPACPGKYLAMVAGDVGSVQSAVEAGREKAQEFLVDSFSIANVHPDIFPALSCASSFPQIDALGIIETYSVASCITAADEAAKAADIALIEIRCATGLAGKSYVSLTGDVSSVNAAVSAGISSLEDRGLIQCYVVIASPSKDLYTRMA